MDAVPVNAEISEAPANDNWWKTGGKIGLWVIFFLSSFFNIFTAVFITPKFEQIFQDALPGKPLPTVTELLLGFHPFVIAVTVLWPVLGLLAILFPKRTSSSIWIIVCLLLLVILQVGVTIIALFMPMIGTTTGMAS